jgi:hypothetical protein
MWINRGEEEEEEEFLLYCPCCCWSLSNLSNSFI